VLRREEVRLLSLTGPAGVGKTRLAIEAGTQVSDDFAQGVVFVDLSPISDPTHVPQALARGADLQDVESPRLPERLLAYLRERNSLVILDNFEQLLSAAAWLADLLAECPSVTLLVTSRAALRLRWEQTYRVQPLGLPDPDHLAPVEDLARIPAVALFVERARAIDSKFALGEGNAQEVAEICVRLDGLPLAIELAAARTSVLSPQMILDRLGHRLSLLQWEARDLPARQRTLRSAIGWSYDLLDEQEQALYRRLGVFAAGFTVDAAQAVTSSGGEEAGHKPVSEEMLNNLASLVENSLVQVEGWEAQEARYRLLESVREYALEQLQVRGEVETARRAHALHFLDLAERAGPELFGREQRAWFLRLEAEQDNLRAALRWLSWRGEHALALRLAATLGYFWSVRGHYSEGRRILAESVGRTPGGATDPRTRALALSWLGVLLLVQGEMRQARVVLEDALAVARSADDPRSVTVSLVCLGICARLSGEWEKSTPLLEEALANSREAGDAWGTARALQELGAVAIYARDYGRAQRLLEEASAGYHRIGDERALAEALLWLVMAVKEQGEASRAAALVRQAFAINRRLRDLRLVTIGAEAVLWLVGEAADPERVTRLMGMNEALRHVMGFARSVWEHALGAPAIVALGARLGEERVAAARTEGYAYSPEQVAELSLEVLDEADEAGPRRAESGADNRHGVLSPRESEVLRLVAEGLSNREIAGRLFVTERTVRSHLSSIFGKLGADNRTQAVALARQQSLL
jgi:predicted ATPase/DNA-binding CsgD family transcriptional regulator/Tfp pilus assembly protein PilF